VFDCCNSKITAIGVLCTVYSVLCSLAKFAYVGIGINFSNTVLHHVFVFIFFTERVVIVWNSVPNNVDFNALTVIKRTIDCVHFFSHLRFST